MEVLNHPHFPCKVIDIFAIPDYASYFLPAFDDKFSRYSRGEWTQHQWIFEAVDPCDSFPLGVKTTYRKYAQDKVIEIHQNVSVRVIVYN